MTEATVYLLERDGVLLARLPLRQDGDGVYQCDFQPTPAFEPYRALFEEDATLANALRGDEEDPLMERSTELSEEIENLGLTVRREGGGIYRNVLLGIDGDTASFRPLEDEEPYDPV